MRRAATAIALVALLLSCSRDEARPTQTATASTANLGPHWRSTLYPCTPAICGAVDVNQSPFRLESGSVEISVDGVVTVKLQGMSDVNGVVGSNKTMEVLHGKFSNIKGWEPIGANPLGTVTTDRSGNFDGTIVTPAGTPFSFGPGVAVKGQFMLNQPGIRTVFVTEADE